MAGNTAMSLFNLERFRYHKEKAGENLSSSVSSPKQEQRRLVNNCSSDKENYPGKCLQWSGDGASGQKTTLTLCSWLLASALLITAVLNDVGEWAFISVCLQNAEWNLMADEEEGKSHAMPSRMSPLMMRPVRRQGELICFIKVSKKMQCVKQI